MMASSCRRSRAVVPHGRRAGRNTVYSRSSPKEISKAIPGASADRAGFPLYGSKDAVWMVADWAIVKTDQKPTPNRAMGE
ncbi:hypothetical protein D3C80_832610 [compost metagenome]